MVLRLETVPAGEEAQVVPSRMGKYVMTDTFFPHLPHLERRCRIVTHPGQSRVSRGPNVSRPEGRGRISLFN